MWLHLDQRAVHDMKVRADAIFGRSHFFGEMVWRREMVAPKKWTLRDASDAPRLRQDNRIVWNGEDPALREPYAGTSQKMHFTNIGEDGRAYRLRTINGRRIATISIAAVRLEAFGRIARR